VHVISAQSARAIVERRIRDVVEGEGDDRARVAHRESLGTVELREAARHAADDVLLASRDHRFLAMGGFGSTRGAAAADR
jgi:hypothetical protein